MPEHFGADGRFQSDKYPDAPADTVPLKVTDPMARDLLATYAERRRQVDGEFAEDLLTRLAETRPKPRRSGREELGLPRPIA